MSGFLNKTKGVITVFISLLLMSVLSFGTLVIEAGRYQSAKNQLSEVNISAATSVLSNYDMDLYQRFGILAFTDDNDTKTNFSENVYFDSDLNAGYRGNNATCLYRISDAKMTGFYNLTYPSVLKRQILSKSKYLRSTYSYAVNTNNVNSFLGSFMSKCSTVTPILQSAISGSNPTGIFSAACSRVESAFTDLKIYDEGCTANLSSSATSILPSKTGTVKDVVPDSEIEAIQATLDDAKTVVPAYSSSIGNVSAVNEDNESTAAVSINYSGIREKMKNQRVTGSGGLADIALNTVSSMQNVLAQLSSGDGAQVNLMVNSYIAKHCANRTYIPNGFSGATDSRATDNFVSACAEYIFCGSGSEKENQEAAYWMIFYMRFVDNLNCISSIRQLSTGSAALKVLLAYYESLIDLELMTSYKNETSVPMTKTSLFLDPSSIVSFNAFTRTCDILDVLKNQIRSVKTVQKSVGDTQVNCYTVNGSDNAGYSDYIAASLWFVSNADKRMRLSDIIQLEMRYKQAHILGETVSFRSKNYYTYCRVETNATFSTLLPVISINGGGNALSVTSFKSIKYVGF